MNRIYQGKVTNVELANPDKKAPKEKKWLPFDPNPKTAREKWQKALWQHHELFQDAVNCYLVALGALADPNHAAGNRVIRDLQARLGEAWEQFPRQPVPPHTKSLRDSVTPWIGLDKNATLKDAFDKIRDGASSDSKTDCLAFLSLLTDLRGDGKIQQGGRQYFPYFCVSETEAHFPRGKVNRLKEEGERILPKLLWRISGPQNANLLADLKEKLHFEYFANPSLEGELLSTDETKERLKEAVNYLCTLQKLSNREEWKQKIDKIQDVQIPAYSGGSINKPPLKNRFYAWLLFKPLQ